MPLRRQTRPTLSLLATIAATGLAACGASSGRPRATLMLDFTPNAVHAGIYSAAARGFDRAAGVRLDVLQPSSSTDSVKLLLAGRIDFAVLDIHDLAIARQAGRDIVGVLPLVQRPLAAVLAQPVIATPRQLAGRTAGVTGLPSDDAVLRSVVAGAGGDPRRVRQVTIGFDAVPALIGNRVSAATAFWDVEGVALTRRRPQIHTFRVDDYGAPAYPELVVSVTRAELRRRRAYVAAVVQAIERGYAVTLASPQASADDELARVPGLDRPLLLAELRALKGAFTTPGERFGAFDRSRLNAWAAWEAHFGIVRTPPAPASMFVTP